MSSLMVTHLWLVSERNAVLSQGRNISLSLPWLLSPLTDIRPMCSSNPGNRYQALQWFLDVYSGLEGKEEMEVLGQEWVTIMAAALHTFSPSSTFLRRRWWHPTPVISPGKSQGRRSLEGWSPWGRWGSDSTERLHFHFSLSCIGEGNGNPLQCSCLGNPGDGGAWWAAVYGIAQSRTRLKWLSSHFPNPFYLHCGSVF